MVHSDYGHALAASVGHLYAFIRPLGDVLTNETVREVIDIEEGFAEDLSDALSQTGEVATKLYDLVSGIFLYTCSAINIIGFVILNKMLRMIYYPFYECTQVKGVWTIHECILPNLPNNTYTSLNPQPPLGVSDSRVFHCKELPSAVFFDY